MRHVFWIISTHGRHRRPDDGGEWFQARDGTWHLRMTNVDYATRPQAWRAIDALGLLHHGVTTVLVPVDD